MNLLRFSCYCIFIFLNICSAETLRIATYNILNFPDAMGSERSASLFTVLDYVKPDILVLQELKNQQGFDMFGDSVVAKLNNNFSAGPFYDGPDTDNGIFFRRDKVNLISTRYIPAGVRDIAEYRLRFCDSGCEFYIFSVHLKSSPGPENEAERRAEVIKLRRHIDSLPTGTYFLILGDFNIYYSDEPAYQVLVDSSAYTRSIKDFYGRSGVWHENASVAFLHTQSARFVQLPDGGADGGLDDRFDMILCSKNFLMWDGIFLDTDSYTILGNDGGHFNLSVNDGHNSAVPAEVADALFYGSDHLPCYVEITDEPSLEKEQPVIKIIPNPLRSESWVLLPWFEDFISARITVTNILGQRVYHNTTKNPQGFKITRNQIFPGVYFVQVEIYTKFLNYRYQTRLAVVE